MAGRWLRRLRYRAFTQPLWLLEVVVEAMIWAMIIVVVTRALTGNLH
jgi:hypothetical protein